MYLIEGGRDLPSINVSLKRSPISEHCGFKLGERFLCFKDKGFDPWGHYKDGMVGTIVYIQPCHEDEPWRIPRLNTDRLFLASVQGLDFSDHAFTIGEMEKLAYQRVFK